jgi:hypothetical protein
VGVLLGRLYELLDLASGQMVAEAQLSVWWGLRRHCSILVAGERLKTRQVARHTACYPLRMERLLDAVLALLCAAMLAMVLSSIAPAEGVSPDVIRTVALSSAGVILVAVACGSLLKRKG